MTESDIRNILVQQLARTPAGEGAAFISEMFLTDYSRRADLIMANGKLSVFEIKSPLDSLDRLEGQLESYLKHFEKVTVVCAPKHIDGVLSIAPESVGVWSMTPDGTIKVARKGRAQKVSDKRAWLSFLPVAEIRTLLKSKSILATGSREKLVTAAETLSVTVIRDYVLSRLKERNNRISELKENRRLISEQVKAANLERERRLTTFLKSAEGLGVLTAIPRRIT